MKDGNIISITDIIENKVRKQKELESYEVQLEDAFPTVLGAVNLDMASSAVQTFDVTFSYRTCFYKFLSIINIFR